MSNLFLEQIEILTYIKFLTPNVTFNGSLEFIERGQHVEQRIYLYTSTILYKNPRKLLHIYKMKIATDKLLLILYHGANYNTKKI